MLMFVNEKEICRWQEYFEDKNEENKPIESRYKYEKFMGSEENGKGEFWRILYLWKVLTTQLISLKSVRQQVYTIRWLTSQIDEVGMGDDLRIHEENWSKT